jgi:hypothetical protein
MKYSEVEQLMEVWLEETLNLEGYTPGRHCLVLQQKLEETLNLNNFILKFG